MNSLRQVLFAASLAVGLALLGAPKASADIVHLDDVIIQFSACVGNDCVNGESFGFDSLRLKENNLRIHFQDTSTSASFPTNDWRIIINDSSNGGANYFAVEDSNAGRQPFRVEAGAPANSLYVEDGGRIGFGTNTPVVNLHVKEGNTPTLRLEQDGSSGFTPQTWDLAGNETNFFIRDVTNGSKLSFRIQPNTPENTIYMANSGRIGVGTNSPSLDNKGIHVKSVNDTTAASAGIGVDPSVSGGCALNLQYGPNQGHTFITARPCSGNERTRMFVGATEVMTLLPAGVQITGTITQNTNVIHPDYVFQPSYELESIEDHSRFMWKKSHLPAVDKASDDGTFEVAKTTMGILEELEKAHIYIEMLNERLKEESEQKAEMADRLARIEAAIGIRAAAENN